MKSVDTHNYRLVVLVEKCCKKAVIEPLSVRCSALGLSVVTALSDGSA